MLHLSASRADNHCKLVSVPTLEGFQRHVTTLPDYVFSYRGNRHRYSHGSQFGVFWVVCLLICLFVFWEVGSCFQLWCTPLKSNFREAYSLKTFLPPHPPSLPPRKRNTQLCTNGLRNEREQRETEEGLCALRAESEAAAESKRCISGSTGDV